MSHDEETEMNVQLRPFQEATNPHRMTAARLREMPEEEQEGWVRVMHEMADSARGLRQRLIAVEDLHRIEEHHRLENEQGTTGSTGAAERERLQSQIRGLLVQLTRLQLMAEDKDAALISLGIALGLLQQGSIPADDPRVDELVGVYERLGGHRFEHSTARRRIAQELGIHLPGEPSRVVPRGGSEQAAVDNVVPFPLTPVRALPAPPAADNVAGALPVTSTDFDHRPY